MSEMIERVARAIHEARYDDPFHADSPVPWVMNAARAAIAAMRDPTNDMRKVCSFETAEIEYPAMIDEALK